ncbi:hypothetical protein AwDysgo_19160 [Bacteroidales bacterium]|nr:hypothetical protein AwDysgo_19160 [Bacteroidales bacterium]
MTKIKLSSLLLLISCFVHAQEGSSVYEFLRFPGSAHVGALGGTNVSLIENDLSLVFQNPSLLGQEMDMNLNLSYTSYIGGIGLGNVAFAKALGDRSTWGIGVNYISYGDMKQTGPDQSVLGTFSAKDMAISGFFSRDLNEKIRGGVSPKIIYSNFEQYSSMALSVDLGLSYYNKDDDFSLGLALKNVGRQVTAYHQEIENFPWDLQLGLTKRLSHAPIRFSLTAAHLNKWKFYDVEGNKDAFLTSLGKHFIVGVDFIPSDNLWIALGYNVKTAADMKLQDANKMGGFSIGAGLKVKSFNVGCALGNYHPSASSFMISLTTSLSEIQL